MIQLEKYNQFLDAFKYAKTDNNMHRYSSRNNITYFKIEDNVLHLLISKYYIDEIRELSTNMNDRFEEAKTEMLNNIFTVVNPTQKISFISLVFYQFLEVYQSYSIIFNYGANTDVRVDLDETEDYDSNESLHEECFNRYITYWHYLKIDCFDFIKKWIDFIDSILMQYNMKFKYNNQINIFKTNTADIFNVFKRLYILPESEEDSLDGYFVIPSQYWNVMDLPQMTEYLKIHGGYIQNAPKQEIASFLHTLYMKKYFIVSSKKELKFIAESVYKIGSTMDRTAKRNLGLFAFIPEAKDL